MESGTTQASQQTRVATGFSFESKVRTATHLKIALILIITGFLSLFALLGCRAATSSIAFPARCKQAGTTCFRRLAGRGSDVQGEGGRHFHACMAVKRTAHDQKLASASAKFHRQL